MGCGGGDTMVAYDWLSENSANEARCWNFLVIQHLTNN